MSYILDALRRADRERRQRAPGARGTAAPVRRRHATRPLVLGGMAALLLINGIALAIWALTSTDPWRQRPDPAAADDVAREAPPAARGESLLAHAAREREPPAWPEPWEIDGDTPTADDEGPAESDSQATPTAPATDKATSAPPAPEPAPPQAADAPILEELPEALRREIGPLELAIHVYATAPEARFVMLRNERLSAGDRLDSGLELVAVLPTGALFRFREQDFRVVVR